MGIEGNAMSSNLGNKRIMADNIRYYMDLNKVSRKEVCQAIEEKKLFN